MNVTEIQTGHVVCLKSNERVFMAVDSASLSHASCYWYHDNAVHSYVWPIACLKLIRGTPISYDDIKAPTPGASVSIRSGSRTLIAIGPSKGIDGSTKCAEIFEGIVYEHDIPNTVIDSVG